MSITNLIQLLLPTIEHFYMLGYWIAFGAALLETTIGIGLLVPGSTIILLMGTLVAKGYFDLGDLLWFAVLGAILGDNINYAIGKKYRSKIFKQGLWFIKPAHLTKGEFFFKKYGTKSILLGRFVPSLKSIVPLIAGVFNMKRLPFTIWNIIGAMVWSVAWILPGYYIAQSFNLTKIWISRVGLILAALLTASVLLYILKIIIIKKGKKIFAFIFSIWLSVQQAIMDNADVKAFIKRHQTLASFLKKRLDKKDFYGLPLTLLSLSLIYLTTLFSGTVEGVINADLVVAADVRTANLLTIFRTTELNHFFIFITLLGKWQVIMIFTIAAGLIFWLNCKKTYITPLLTGLVGSEVFVLIGKLLVQRARPETALYPETSFSFPSGHAAIAVTFYGFITYILIKSTKQWKLKTNAFFVGMLLIMLIGFSRLYLGVHYASDVWGGYLAGAIWLIIAISANEYFLSKKQTQTIFIKTTKKIWLTGVIIIMAISCYIIFAFNYNVPTIEAYKIQPSTINNISALFTTDKLKYTETLKGNKQEPISFVIIAKNNQQLMELFKNAGWFLADEISIYSATKLATSAAWKKSYEQAPMTPDFWNTKVHDFGFEKADQNNNVRSRHHTRFWQTNYQTQEGYNIYVGAASFDSNIKWGVTHKIDPDIDIEREFLFSDLQKTGMITNVQKKQLVKPILGKNFSGDLFFTDGQAYILTLNN